MLRIPVESRASRTASAWAEVDLGAIAHNVRVLRAALPEQSRLIAVVKSDGYGHGMLRVARTALQNGAVELAVANVQEGAALRAAGIRAPILIAGPTAIEDAPAVVQHGLVASIGCLELASALARATRRFLPVQIEVDSGMTRHGVAPSELGSFVSELESRGRLAIAGVYTHFAGVTRSHREQMERQLATFVAAVDSVRSLRGVRRHASNSLGALLLPGADLDAVRIGGAMYGIDPLRTPGSSDGQATSAEVGGERDHVRSQLRPAIALKAHVVGLRDAAVGDRVGYGGSHVCQRPTRLALLPIGYGEGLARDLWASAEVLVRGRRAPIVGRISMNQTVVDVTDLPEIVFGEEVVLLGEMGDQRIRPEDLAGETGCAYEVTSLLPARLSRVFRVPQVEAAASNGDVAGESCSRFQAGSGATRSSEM